MRRRQVKMISSYPPPSLRVSLLIVSVIVFIMGFILRYFEISFAGLIGTLYLISVIGPMVFGKNFGKIN